MASFLYVVRKFVGGNPYRPVINEIDLRIRAGASIISQRFREGSSRGALVVLYLDDHLANVRLGPSSPKAVVGLCSTYASFSHGLIKFDSPFGGLCEAQAKSSE